MAPTHSNPLVRLSRILEQVGVPYAVIGGHAVNAWLTPRFTEDVDVTVLAGPAELTRLEAALRRDGLAVVRVHGAELASGPDFMRMRDQDLVVEIQTAKTDLQRELIRRALPAANGVRVCTPEDLIVLKVIANRPKDQADLHGLLALPALDWQYIERWAAEWEVLDELERLRRR